jgi:beta-lactamase regulating signal transducer with metallopeptidase domain
MATLNQYYPGDQVLNVVLAATLAVVLVSSTAWLLSRRLSGKAALRHLVLFSALICCLAAPVLAWFCAAAGVTLVSISIPDTQQAGMTATVNPIEVNRAWTPPPKANDPRPTAAESPSPQANATPGQNAKSVVPFKSAERSAKSSPDQPNVRRTDSRPATMLTIREIATAAIFIWVAGALLMLARLATNCVRVVQLRRSSRPPQHEHLHSQLQKAVAKLGARRSPLLLVSSREVAPLAVDFGQPAIILPERLLGSVSESELLDILMHEVAHLKRGDQRVVLLQALAGALYWPIVSVHGLNRELRWAREEICDNVVLASRSAIDYGETLLHVAQLLVQARPMVAAAGIMGGRGKLERRIAGLIDPRRNMMTTTSRKAACAVLFMFIAACIIVSTTRFAASGATSGVAQSAPPIAKVLSAPEPDDPKFAGHFNGRVTGPDGQPLSHARLYVAPLSDSIDGRIEVPAHTGQLAIRTGTDADGRFAFDAPDMTITDLDGLPTRRECLVIATADGYAPDWVQRWGRTRGSTIRDPANATGLALQLVADDVPIHGRLLDADGRPLAGARVRVLGLSIPMKRDLDAYLAKQRKLNIFADGSGSAEQIFQWPQLLPEVTTETRTDANGEFTLAGFGRERLVQLIVSAPSVVDTYIAVMTRNAPDVHTRPDGDGHTTQVIYGANFSLQLKHGESVSGVVRDFDTHEPIPGMWVGSEYLVYPLLNLSVDHVVTDAQGRFTITGLSPSASRRKLGAAPAPGMAYQSAIVEVEDKPVIIECRRGIPFHLKVVNEQGQPVDAEVTSTDILPSVSMTHPYYRAARNANGTYQGFVMPGPCAVLVKAARPSEYRPAMVDPKAFFAPGRTDFDAKNQAYAYGTKDVINASIGLIHQNDYAAIVLVNPKPSSPALELSATLVKDTPRQVSLVDPDAKPVIGVKTHGMTGEYDYEPPLRAASFSLPGLHPDRVKRITFKKEDRKLIGLLLTRDDGATPYTVRMEPWGTLVGRIVDEIGNAIPDWKAQRDWKGPLKLWADINSDPNLGDRHCVDVDSQGRFRMDELVSGQRYHAGIYEGMGASEKVFENVVLRPGEVRDLGDLHTKLPSNVKDKRRTAHK